MSPTNVQGEPCLVAVRSVLLEPFFLHRLWFDLQKQAGQIVFHKDEDFGVCFTRHSVDRLNFSYIMLDNGQTNLVNTARFLKYVLSIFDIIHKRVE